MSSSFEKKPALTVSGRQLIDKRSRQEPSVFNDDLLRNDKGEIVSLNPDSEFVTASSALKYTIDRTNKLHAELKRLKNDKTPQGKKQKIQFETELGKLDTFRKEIDKATKAPEAIVRRRAEGSDVLVENLMYNYPAIEVPAEYTEALQAKKNAPTTEAPKPEPREVFTRDTQGRVFGLRADEQFVTTDEAHQFITEKTARLKEDLSRIDTSSATEREKDRRRSQIDHEIEKLMDFQEKTDLAATTHEAIATIKEGAQALVENPYFKEAETRRRIGKKLDRTLQADRDSIDVNFDEDTEEDGSIDVEFEEPINPLIRGKDGHIVALRADVPTITLSEANLFLADKFASLTSEMKIINESGLPIRDKKQALKKLDEETAELRAFSRKVENAEKSPANKERRYAGIEAHVENPYYDAEIIASEDELIDDVDTKDPLDEKHQELQALYRQRNLLMKERDLIIHGLKTGEPVLNKLIEGKRERAAYLDQPIIYPATFPSNIAAAKTREQLLREAAAIEEMLSERKRRPVIRRELVDLENKKYELEHEAAQLERARTYPETESDADRRLRAERLRSEAAAIDREISPGRFPNIGEALRTILAQIDDLQEQITTTEKNVQFLQRKRGLTTPDQKAA